jgi:hypothetical protein
MVMQIVYRNIRFSAKVDRCLRRRWRMHGDLSIRVREALDGVNLREVELLKLDSRKVHATQVGVFESAWLAAHEAASARRCSVNTLVNSEVWAAFGAQRPGQRGRPRGRNRQGGGGSRSLFGSSCLKSQEEETKVSCSHYVGSAEYLHHIAAM